MVNGSPSAAPTRAQFQTLHELLDQSMFQLDTRGFDAGQVDFLRRALVFFGKRVVDACERAFSVGTARGIEQTAAVFCDPEFYTVTKKQRAVTRRNQLDRHRQETAERERQKLNPATPQEIDNRREHLARMVAYYKREGDRYQKQLDEFNQDPARCIILARVNVGGLKQ
jgi:hypothetical protein